jgi:hypothetical protein
MLEDGVFDLPLAPDRSILIRMSSEQVQTYVDRKLRNLGADEKGVAYRDRVEISRETEEEGEAVQGEREDCRQRGRDWIQGRAFDV